LLFLAFAGLLARQALLTNLIGSLAFPTTKVGYGCVVGRPQSNRLGQSPPLTLPGCNSPIIGRPALVFLLPCVTEGQSAAAVASEHMHISSEERPEWRNGARELWWRSRLVKRFWHDAASQCLILLAFEEQAWPPRIDDPLPRAAGLNPKARLRETVKSLHRGQRPLVLQFRTDGTGRGVRWEPVQ
jgi:hypothetical protein